MIDLRKLISLIKGRPEFYDDTLPCYTDERLKRKLLFEICKDLIEGWEKYTSRDKSDIVAVVGERWHNLKRSFEAEYRIQRRMARINFEYYDQLLFLTPIINGSQKHSQEISEAPPPKFRSRMQEFHGPYMRGLGRRSPSAESEENGGRQEESSQYSFCELPVNKRPRITHLDTEVIPKFDPAKKNVNVIGWLHKIDQLGDIYNWEERDKVFVMQTRLRGAARVWYNDLEDYNATWGTWKEWLTKAFPRTTDFVERLEEMLARQKGNETMTRYYHDKICLMKRCGLDGENAMSCLIRGLPIEVRANAKACGFKTPEDLYHGFLSSLENYGAKTNRLPSDQRPSKSTWQRGSAKVCYNCRRPPHAAKSASARDTLPTPAGMRLGGARGTCRRHR